jgi:hypothetical protein
MSQNNPRTSGAPRGSGGSGGGRPPSGSNPPPQDTPGRDPLDTFPEPFGEPLPSAFGPARSSRQSPAPSPYSAGQETPRAPRLTSASAQAARAAQLGASPASPMATSSAPPATPSRESTVSRPNTPGSVGSDGGGDTGWRDPTAYAESIGGDAAWMRELASGQFDELSRNEKRRIGDSIAELLKAASEAGVWSWPSADVQEALSQLPSVPRVNPFRVDDEDVFMAPADSARPPQPPRTRGRPPVGSRPLPRPPVGGRAGASKGKGRAMGPPPPVNLATRPPPPKGTYAQAARFTSGAP